MGCRVSKNESVSPDATTMSRYNTSSIDYKARLERKLCLAKETPEPDFDLSDCMIKDVPSGVFILCRVLRKEILNLSKNRLHSLKGGGFIGDLALLRTLDMRFNQFKKLPDDICKLLNLRELMISNNQLELLPVTINQLQNLELLDVSYNKLVQINEINCMAHLRILNISGNPKLTTLPNELSTCDSLVDIILDPQTITYPSQDISERGALDILNFLATGHISEPSTGFIGTNTEHMKTIDIVHDDQIDAAKLDVDKIINDKKELLEQERVALEKNVCLEAELHNKQQKRKQELLQQLILQQTENDNLVSKLQQEKDSERNKLIGDILKAEEDSSMVVDKLLSLKNGPDPMLIELERREQEFILEKLSIEHSDLRKQEVLAAMSDILTDEAKTIQSYQEQKDASTKEILQREHETNMLLNDMFQSNDKDRTMAVVKIMQDEELQKSAVATLITKNDARSWGLVEQVRIVEAQLAAMTHYEIERRKFSVDERLNELSARRLNLTFILLDLMDQQSKRKDQLLDTLVNMENQKQNEQQDFWLLQYQKLIDSQPTELSMKSASLDPLLGYSLLVNGVVHCIPFLSKLWQNKQINLEDVTVDDLRAAGVKNPSDHINILKSIREYIEQQTSTAKLPNAPSEKAEKLEQAATSITEENTGSEAEPYGEMLAECVVCMEQPCKIIFLPCGHLCCCLNCHTTLQLCPMCRTEIDRRIKVIQP